MWKWNIRKCKMEILEKTEAAPWLPHAGKSCKPISKNHTWKTACCLDFHVVKESVAQEPPRNTTCLPLCSYSHRVHQPPGAHDQGSMVTTGRSGDNLLHCQGFCCFLWWPQEIPGLFRAFQSTHKLHDTIWSQVLCPPCDTEGNGMNSKLLKYTATDTKDLLLDYIDILVCETR